MSGRWLFVDTGREWGGGTNSLLLLARGLAARGQPVAVAFCHDYAGAAGSIGEAFAATGIPFHLLPAEAPGWWRRVLRELLRAALGWRRDWREAALRRLDRRWRVLPLARRLAALARVSGATLLVGNNQPSSNQAVLHAGRIAALPVVLHVRKTTRLGPEEIVLANTVARRIVCVSESVRRHYLVQGLRPALCVTVPNGIDPDALAPLPRAVARAALGLPEAGFAVGTVCSLLPLKCVEHLLEAFAASASSLGEDARCAVIGDGPERERLERIATRLGIAAQVRFTGFREDASRLLPALDLFALASRQEGMPRSILEAMLAGLPVVAADVPGCRDLVADGETGFLYPHGNTARLAEHLRTLAGAAALRRQLGSHAAAVVRERYTLDAHVARMAVVLAEAAA